MPNTISPNMGLIVPGVGTEPGPDWANDLNSDLGILDQHNHSAGQGVQITPSGLNINSDLSINSNNLTQVKTVNFQALVSSLAGATPNLGCIYVAGNELYYNDEAGNVVQVTNNGSVNAGAGSITGLPSGTASASYSSGSGTFIWQSATNTAANMDNASVTIRQQLAGAKGITLSSPSSLAADYSLIFPAALPGSTSFLTVDTSGNIGDSISTSGGITTTMIATGTIIDANISPTANIQGSKLLDGSVSVSKLLSPMPTGSTVAIDGFAKSAFITSFSTTSSIYQPFACNVTITTSGRPVFIGLVGDSSGGNEGRLNPAGFTMFYRIYNVTSGLDVTTGINVGETTIGPSMVWGIDSSIIGSPGTYTYDFQIHSSSGNNISVEHIAMVAYEI